MTNRVTFLAGILFLVGIAKVEAQPASYDVIVIKPPVVNRHSSFPISLDEFGNVMGNVRNGEPDEVTSNIDLAYRGFYYFRASGEILLAPIHMIYTDANNFGQIVGGRSSYSGTFEPGERWEIWDHPKGWINGGGLGLFWYAPGGEALTLPPHDGDTITIPTGINDLGLIAGISTYQPTELPIGASAVIWQADVAEVAAPFVLPPVPDCYFCVAAGISPPNANGISTIFGQAGNAWNGEPVVPVRWKVKLQVNGQLKLVEGPTLIGPIETAELGSEPYSGAASNSGASIVGENNGSAFKSPNNGNFRLLPILKVNGESARFGSALGVNENRDIVGFQYMGIFKRRDFRAVVWYAGRGKPVDLNTLCDVPDKWQLTLATDINEAGEIIAYQDKPSTFSAVQKAVLLIPRTE